MEVSKKALSRKGTLGSMPKAKGDLLALATSHRCSLSTFLTVSLHRNPSISMQQQSSACECCISVGQTLSYLARY